MQPQLDHQYGKPVKEFTAGKITFDDDSTIETGGAPVEGIVGLTLMDSIQKDDKITLLFGRGGTVTQTFSKVKVDKSKLTINGEDPFKQEEVITPDDPSAERIYSGPQADDDEPSSSSGE